MNFQKWSPFFSFRLYLLTFSIFLIGNKSFGEIVRLEIKSTEIYENGKSFGSAGTFERITGIAYGEISPRDKHNLIIQDIGLAPANNAGRVSYATEFILLRPLDPQKSNGLLFTSLPNRGNVFPPDTVLLGRGYTYLWTAWQGDVLPGNKRLTIQVPVATENGREITGKIRSEFEVAEITPTLSLSSGYFNGLIHHAYETVSMNTRDAILTRRILESDPRQQVAPDDWAFSDCSGQEFPGKPSTTRISVKGGFNPDYIYELIYTGKNPLVLGLGFAAVRDLASFFKNTSPANPLQKGRQPLPYAILQGVSQCGNFTRSFLHLGFNQDEKNRMVFDGVSDHIGTRRISLNIRFGRPGGGGIQREDHFFPSNDAPFSWDVTTDPVSGIKGGMLETCLAQNACPKIMQTFSSSEYWQLRASLRTTDTYGTKDLAIPDQVRIYLFNSTQHSPFRFQDKISGFTTNYNPFQQNLRALMIALEEWIISNTPPPPSLYPRLDNHTLVNADQKSTGWPDIPGVIYNGKTNSGPLLDHGPLYRPELVSGILSEPPLAVPGKYYEVKVPVVDKDGNELGGIRSPELQAPLGTYTGWSLRKKDMEKAT